MHAGLFLHPGCLDSVHVAEIGVSQGGQAEQHNG
jgi:hypothetical protein